MSRTQGEGRAPAEKEQRILSTPERRRQQRAKRKAEDKEWAERSGPVTIKHAKDFIDRSVDEEQAEYAAAAKQHGH